jgi:hypothetical protein
VKGDPEPINTVVGKYHRISFPPVPGVAVRVTLPGPHREGAEILVGLPSTATVTVIGILGELSQPVMVLIVLM